MLRMTPLLRKSTPLAAAPTRITATKKLKWAATLTFTVKMKLPLTVTAKMFGTLGSCTSKIQTNKEHLKGVLFFALVFHYMMHIHTKTIQQYHLNYI